MKKLMALAMAAAFTAPAFAGDFYAGGDVGRNRFSQNGVSFNKTGLAVFGGYKLNDTVSLEAGYRSLLKETASQGSVSASVDLYALQFSGVFSAPVSNEFSVYGRLGLNSLRGDVKIKEGNVTYSDSSNETKFLWGIGASYAFTKDVALRVEFQKPVKEVQVLSVGVKFAF
ncbi:outer membrane beta-barrel protein [Roseateles sp. DB2]|uniref:outer membrane beta-barrel protein n=1 Tax=Roseateles sp. DB2 TaxID=3453717 RepID=UPI003EEA281C